MPARTAKRRGRKANKTRNSGRPPALNIRSPSQFGKLSSLMGKAPIILVFVYADWCGHCQTFKPDWKKLEMNKQRNMPLVAVSDVALPKSPLSSMVTAEGYPTVTVVSPANNMSFNLPTREPTALTNLVTNANKLVVPGSLSSNVNSVLTGVGTTTSQQENRASTVAIPSNSKREVKLFDATGQEGVQTSKPPTQVLPVTRDTVEPPLSEAEFAEREGQTEGTEGRRPYNQLGGVYNMLTSYQRRR